VIGQGRLGSAPATRRGPLPMSRRDAALTRPVPASTVATRGLAIARKITSAALALALAFFA
jgi:hypothetical protein